MKLFCSLLIADALTGGGELAASQTAETVPDQATPERVTLVSALTAAREGLKAALQSARFNGIGDAASINRLENEFENAKNVLAGNTAAYGHLQNAAGGLKLAVDLLANHSLQDATDLRRAKNAAGLAETHLKQLAPPTV